MNGLNLYLLCFGAGFLLDKLRFIPFIIGLLTGILLKTLVDNKMLFSNADINQKMNQLYTSICA
jgi:hypothetical protein